MDSRTSIALSFEFSEDFLVEAIKRRRRAQVTLTKLLLLKILPTVLMIPIAFGLMFELRQFAAGSFLIVMILFLYVAQYLDFWIAKRRHRRSQFNNEFIRFSFSRENVHVKSKTLDATYQWEIFSRGVIFKDGLLLFHGSATCNWLPFRFLEQPTKAEAFSAMVMERMGNRISQR